MNRNLALISILCLCLVPQQTQAQAPYVPGGLFVHPTAFVPPVRELSLYAASFTEQEGSQATYASLSLSYVPISRLQVGGSYVYHQDKNLASHSHIGPSIKYQLSPDTPTRPAFAIAGTYLPHDHLAGSVAALASHRFATTARMPVTLHVGAKWGEHLSHTTDYAGFVGVQLQLSSSLDLVGETSTRFKFDRKAASSIGFMYHRSGIDISVGMINGGRSSRMDPFIGVGMPIGH